MRFHKIKICLFGGALLAFSFVSAAVPLGLRAISGNGIVSLVWQRPDTLHSMSYRIYRSTSAGNTGTVPLVSNFKEPPIPTLKGFPVTDNLNYLAAYGDKSVTNGTTYYYQVTTISNGVESPKSLQVEVKPLSYPHAISKSHFLKILPLGNSITSGYAGDSGSSFQGGYRLPLINKLKSSGYQFLLVGSCIDLSEEMEDPYHEGWGGRMVSDLIEVVSRALPTYAPDLILLDIGTNNFAWGIQDTTVVLDDYRNLLRKIFELKPDQYILVAPIPPLTMGDETKENVDAFNKGVKRIVDSVQLTGKNITWANELAKITEADIAAGIDEVHPLAVSYTKIGGLWFDAVTRITDVNTGIYKRAFHVANEKTLRFYSVKGRLHSHSQNDPIRLFKP